jgi:hypothetical protein
MWYFRNYTDFESIASNPNFVFQADENYTAVVLYNSEGSQLMLIRGWNVRTM